MKALEKDRTRRYETANGFAADIERAQVLLESASLLDVLDRVGVQIE